MCRYCAGETEQVARLKLPVPNKYYSSQQEALSAEKRPHNLHACKRCGSFMLSNAPFTPEELFAGNYAFVPVGNTWKNHCVELARELAKALPENAPNERGVIYDIGGNDGVLSSVLYRVCDRTTMIVDPSDVAPFQDGIHWPKRKGFFGESFARDLLRNGERLADAITATNVLAHVPDPLDFMRGVKTLLAPEGIAVFEFPDGDVFGSGVLFDTVYAEHIGYLTLEGFVELAARAGLYLYGVTNSAIHGGSVRAYLSHKKRSDLSERQKFNCGDFESAVTRKLAGLESKLAGKTFFGFGSAAKSVVINSLVKPEAVPRFIIDETPAKISRYQPGSGAFILPLPSTYREAMNYLEKDADDVIRNSEICVNYAWNYAYEVREKLTRAGFKGEIVTVHDF